MFDWWTPFCLTAGDAVLGWALRLPFTAALLIVSLVTAALMTLVRLFTTSQDQLGRAARDTDRLNELIREAKQKKDIPALQRFRQTKNQLALLKMKAEGLPLLVSILPIAILATWALSRLEVHPPAAGETVKLIAYPPVSNAGQVMHLVPVEGLAAPNGWVQPVIAVKNPGGPPNGEATWELRGAARETPYKLTLRLKNMSFERELLVGQTTYTAPIDDGAKDPGDLKLTTQLVMQPAKPFGVIPPLGEYVPAWLLGYLLVVVPLVFGLKKVMHIH